MPVLTDPLVGVRAMLLADPAVTALVGNAVYATPDLPKGHVYPCIRLTHTGSSGHAPVAFRHSLSAMVQIDLWAETMADMSALAEVALNCLHGVSRQPGILHIRPTFEARELDEAAQPPLYRYRADLLVRVSQVEGE